MEIYSADDASTGSNAFKGTIPLSGLRGLALSLYEIKEVWFTASEMGMGKVPNFNVGFAFQNALLQLRNFMESVHVELTDKRVEILVLEPPTENLARELFMIRYCVAKLGSNKIARRR